MPGLIWKVEGARVRILKLEPNTPEAQATARRLIADAVQRGSVGGNYGPPLSRDVSVSWRRI